MPPNYLNISRLLALLALLAGLLVLVGIPTNVPLLPIAVVLLALAMLIP